jgi:hypothetical protein
MMSMTVTEGGKRVTHDLEALKLSGVFAHKLPGDALFRQLRAHKVSDVNVNMGKQDLLLPYSRHLKAREAAASLSAIVIASPNLTLTLPQHVASVAR